ncbi:peptidoglycan DD-metalloendopeptidase family protein [candidate division KSB1 bacterium]|nr:peptidoglycan DD-metalloendopeptidase family protein [candidate division KSB1 bacterium]
MQSKRNYWKLIFWLEIGLVSTLTALADVASQDKPAELRQQIESYRARVREQEQEEVTTLDRLEQVEKQIVSTRNQMRKLQQEEKLKNAELQQMEQHLQQTETELEHLKALYAKRLVYFYKYGLGRDIELLLNLNSFNQVYLWIKYQKILADNDRRNIQSIASKKTDIILQQSKVKKIWTDTQKFLEHKNQENVVLKTQQQQRQEVLANIRKNKALNLKKIREAESSLAQIESLIATQERERQRHPEQLQLPAYSNFRELKGRLPWPVTGKIIKKFGNYRHPTLKTVTTSLGIDIQSETGTSVAAVADGQVARIQWMRGIGILVLLNHAGGYYTVYANLGEVLVEKDQVVQMNQVIGRVGDPSLEEPAQVHFEIWTNNQAVNPLTWLQH